MSDDAEPAVTIEVRANHDGDLGVLAAHLAAAVRAELVRLGVHDAEVNWDAMGRPPAGGAR
jgi:hypothetical protein